MREIKFRAWVAGFLPEQSGMFYGIDLLRNTISGGYDRISVHRNNNNYKFKSEEEPFTLMQYTGLLDKNGIEIYEGDILRDNEGFNFGGIPELIVVEWEYAGFLPWSSGKIAAGRLSFTEPDKHCEVIGNIYENPELLNAKD